MNSNKSGFALVELTVIIVVLVILGAISATGISIYLEDARNEKRATNALILSEALEKFYDKNGEYPSCTFMSGIATGVIATLSIDESVLLTPSTPAGVTNAITCNTSVFPSADNDVFMYEDPFTSPSDPNQARTKYEILYYKEGGGGTGVIYSRRGQS